MAGRGDKGLLITTGTFTAAARAEATRDGAPPVDLIDGDRLCDLLREHGTPLLYAHSLRVFLFGSLRGRHRGLHVDPELLYVGAVFHDFGLTPNYRSRDHRFEVDGANAARDFLRAHGIDEESAEVVWDAIALHTTPEMPYFNMGNTFNYAELACSMVPRPFMVERGHEEDESSFRQRLDDAAEKFREKRRA